MIVLDGQFGLAVTALANVSALTARRTRSGGTNKMLGAVAPGRVMRSFPAGIVPAVMDALSLSGTGQMRLCRKSLVPDA